MDEVAQHMTSGHYRVTVTIETQQKAYWQTDTRSERREQNSLIAPRSPSQFYSVTARLSQTWQQSAGCRL